MVTSRRVLALGRLVRVTPLSQEDAEHLLVNRALARGVTIDPGADLQELARRLDGLPLGLELAAGRLGVLSVRDVLDRLGLSLLRAGREGRQATLRGALAWSWELLSPNDRMALTQLSVFAGGFSVEASEQVLVLSEGAPLDAITSLVQYSLVTPVAGGRFKLLSSVREFAALNHAEPRLIEVRHGVWCAGLLARSGPAGSRAQLDVLMLERENLLAACHRAIDRGDTEVAVPTLEAAWLLLDQTGPFHVASTAAEDLLALPLSPALESRTRRCLAVVLWRRGEMADARHHLDRALAISHRTGDESGVADALAHSSMLHEDRNESEEAERAAMAALAIARRRREQTLETRCLIHLGVIRTGVGRHDEALHALYGARKLAEALGHRRFLGAITANVALVQGRLGRREEAAAAYLQSLAIHREIGNRRSQAAVLTNIGIGHFEEGRPIEARRALDEAMSIARDVGSRRRVSYILGTLGNIYFTEGNLTEARQHYEASGAIHAEMGNRRSQGVMLGNVGLVCMQQGRPADAREHYEAALAIARQFQNRTSEGYLLGLMSVVHHEEGHLDLAVTTCLAAIDLQRQNGDRRAEGESIGRMATYLQERGQWDEVGSALNEALQIAIEVGDVRVQGGCLTRLAEFELERGDPGVARELLNRAEPLVRNTDPAVLAELLCLRAALLWRGGERDLARATFKEAEGIAPTEDIDAQIALTRTRAVMAEGLN
jgi:tetratricopeptide (TPR) repeat protein